MNTPVSTLLAVAATGGRLRPGEAGKLRMLLPASATDELKAAVRHHKSALLELLKLEFLIIESAALGGAILFWAPDDDTKISLVQFGADASAVYTAEELRLLANKRVTVPELAAIHASRRAFGGRVTGHE